MSGIVALVRYRTVSPRESCERSECTESLTYPFGGCIEFSAAALVPAVIALTVLGVLGILSIGLPILAAGILALVSLLRPGRHPAL